MLSEFFVVIALLAPALLALTALVTRSSIDVKRIAVFASAVSIVSTALCGLLVIDHGSLHSQFLGIGHVGFSIRLDAISAVMLFMIALLGFIIVRFSVNYLDGESRQSIFIGRLAATLASIHLLVMSGNIGLLFITWILTSISLHRLLLFYPERRGAIIAAKKKFLVARAGDLCLFIAFALLYKQFGSGDLGVIFEGSRNIVSTDTSAPYLEAAAFFLVLAALLKSAQFPTHGWLIEIMETPTPVSALLHAGLLNAGPFLVIRMAHVMDAATVAPLVLILVGGLTALFASAAYMTQPSIKTALGYSSVAHMGFSLMLGGLGVYAAAMLHVVAHSFYKAHAFLSSGSVIDVLRASRIDTPRRAGHPWRIGAGIAIALALFVITSLLWEVDVREEFSVLAVGAIIMMGLIMMFTAAIDSRASGNVLFKTTVLAVLVLNAFFFLETGTRRLLASELPALAAPSSGTIILTAIMILAFGSVVVVQVLAVARRSSPLGQALAIHLRNGLYANAFFDRIVGTLRISAPSDQRDEEATALENVEARQVPVEQPA
jgi:NAD(P)H-quinone oxidoreductase subunit 5